MASPAVLSAPASADVRRPSVDRRYVREVQPWFKGDYVLILRSGAKVTTGETYRGRVRELIGAR